MAHTCCWQKYFLTQIFQVSRVPFRFSSMLLASAFTVKCLPSALSEFCCRASAMFLCQSYSFLSKKVFLPTLVYKTCRRSNLIKNPTAPACFIYVVRCCASRTRSIARSEFPFGPASFIMAVTLRTWEPDEQRQQGSQTDRTTLKCL